MFAYFFCLVDNFIQFFKVQSELESTIDSSQTNLLLYS